MKTGGYDGKGAKGREKKQEYKAKEGRDGVGEGDLPYSLHLTRVTQLWSN